MTLDNATPLDAKTEEIYKEIYKERLERETYTHGIVWKAESYFTALVSGLIAAGFTIATFNLYATYGLLLFAIVITFLGRYVLIKEGGYFHQYRYERIKIFQKLGYDKLEILKDFPEFQNISATWEKYRDKYVDCESGTRYAFRLIYLFQASMCMLVYWVLLLSSMCKSVTLSGIEGVLPIDVINVSFFAVLTIIVIVGYGWEIKSVYKKIRNT